METFELQLERTRLRAMLAIERIAAQPDEGARERLRGELAAVERAIAKQPAGRAAELAARLGLDSEELDLLWTAVAVAVDPQVLPHAVVLGGPDARRGLSLATYALIGELDARRARRLAERLVRAHPLLEDHLLGWASEAQSPAARPLVAAPRTISWLAGSDQPDPAMAGAGAVVEVLADPALDARQREAAAALPRILTAQPAPLVVVEGAAGSGRRTAIATVAAALGRAVVALDLRRLPREPAALEAGLIGLRRECRLRDAIPLVADIDQLAEGSADPAIALRALARFADALPGPFAATASQPGLELPTTRPLARVRWSTPDIATRTTLWQRALGRDAAAVGEALDGVAIRYRLGAGGIGRAVASARLLVGGAPVTAAHLVEGVRTNIAERLGDLALRQEVQQTWDDLVLAPDILDQVKALTARVRHAHRVLEQWGFGEKLPRGQGVAALFSGPPGTGKTMVAGLIARELDLELYQVDLSKVVSKWVGETEKQLGRIFEAADAGHALLLFDEADALFAKRTEVKSSNDRYANLEVNYLLQRIESFGGVTILTTNLDASIDPALRRRLAANIVFWPPDHDERVRLWRGVLAAGAPVAGDVDLEALAASFGEMTGANIRNAVLAAAFLAAAEDGPITQARLERAARGEYASMGRVLDSRKA
jgi:AAA+ superfamily predicted ATPase